MSDNIAVLDGYTEGYLATCPEADIFIFDDVNGVIVGGDYGQCWITYEGRKQGKTMYPCDETEALEMCTNEKTRIKAECGEAFTMIYPNARAWTYHFDGI